MSQPTKPSTSPGRNGKPQESEARHVTASGYGGSNGLRDLIEFMERPENAGQTFKVRVRYKGEQVGEELTVTPPKR